MKQAYLMTVLLLTTVFANAQVSKIQLPYTKDRAFDNGKWQPWSAERSTERDMYGNIPTLLIKKSNSQTFYLLLDQGQSRSNAIYSEVKYDDAKTKQIRTSNSNNALYAYKFTEMGGDYVWTQNITLDELYTNPEKWKTTAAYVYFWEPSLGNASMYTATSPSNKLQVKYKQGAKFVKGGWKREGYIRPLSSECYIVIKTLVPRREFNIKYYENGRLDKDYNVTYNEEMTKEERKNTNNANANCYKINGSKHDWVFVSTGSLTALTEKESSQKLVSNPKTEIMFLDDESAGEFSYFSF